MATKGVLVAVTRFLVVGALTGFGTIGLLYLIGPVYFLALYLPLIYLPFALAIFGIRVPVLGRLMTPLVALGQSLDGWPRVMLRVTVVGTMVVIAGVLVFFSVSGV
ncbi:MAG: hypothetical protein EXR47_02250 [Dehalococcoidia bacterium]|nr:hypothetical protein [Dehalococcoidia bacterium]